MRKITSILFLLSLYSCGTIVSYHVEKKPSWPHGNSFLAEIQLNNDSMLFEQFEYFSGANGADQYHYNGYFKINEDTITIMGNTWDYNSNDSIWYKVDSTNVVARYLKKGNKLIENSPLSTELFDSTSVVYTKGKSRKLRRINRQDSLVWFNQGHLRKPFGEPKTSDGFR